MSKPLHLTLVSSQAQSSLHEEALTALIFGTTEEIRAVMDRLSVKGDFALVPTTPAPVQER